MKKFSAKAAKDEFGRLLDTAQREPIQIEKHGRPVAVVISLEEYQRLEALEDAYWADQAKRSSSKGYLSHKESEKLLADLLHVKD